MRYVVIVRGRLKAATDAAAEAAHQALFDKLSSKARSLGNTGHLPLRGAQDPGEFVVIDVWESLDGLRAVMEDPSMADDLASVYAEPPDVSVWEDPGWASYL